MKDSESGYIHNNSSGVINPDSASGERTSDYIPVSPGENFTFQTWATAYNNAPVGYYWMIYFAWYADKTAESHVKIERFHGGQVGFNHATVTATAPDSAKYVRVSARLYSDGKIKVERGSTATGWCPAPEDVVVRSELDDIFNSDRVASDLLDYASQDIEGILIRFTYTNKNTTNTPSKDGLTGCTAGEAIIIGRGNYKTLLYIPAASTDMFIRRRAGGNWEEWRKITSVTADVMSDEESNDMETIE